MARETKVGLLAGLAFIVCFAVILTNRGRYGPPGLAGSVLTDAALNVPSTVSRSSAPHRTSADDASPDRRQGMTGQPTTNPNPRGPAESRPYLGQGSPASGAELPGEPVVVYRANYAEPRMANNVLGYPSGGSAYPTDRRAAEPNAEALERLLASRPQPAALQPAESSGLSFPAERPVTNPPPVITGNTAGGETTIGRPADGSGVATPSTTDVEPPVHGGKSYTVLAGDTLTKVAASQYGTKARSAIQAIVDANRGVLTDPDQLKVGMVLTIPPGPFGAGHVPKEGLVGAGATTGTSNHTVQRNPGTAPRAASTSESSGYKWYQVRKNDRYASIAREQLGDAGRWREVYEMNRDKFPNPQLIREGVRIKIPMQKGTRR